MTAAVPVAARPVLTFEEDAHRYAVDGRTVPSVTQILSSVYGDLIWPWRNEYAMDRGRKVHQALHLWVLRDLDVKSLSPYIAGYVAAGIRFLMETGFVIRTAEHRMYSNVYGYAGTLDLIGDLDRRSALADWKTGEPGYACGPQTAAYSQLWQEETGEVIKQRFGVHLHEDGSYHLIPYKSREDWPDFLAALRVHQRRRLLGKETP
jgi:hypothetical protein